MPAALRPSMRTCLWALAGAWTALSIAAGCSNTVVENTGGAGGGGGPGGGGANVCSAFADPSSLDTVTLHIRNESPEPIFIKGTCSGQPRYQLVKSDDDDDTVSFPLDRSCFQSCGDLQKESLFSCDACLPAVTRIEPGGTRDVFWDGTGRRGGNTMPAQCWSDPSEASECTMVVAAKAGPWSAFAQAFSACNDCECDPDGNCSGTVSGQSGASEAKTFKFPDEPDVDVVFGSCTFGCPD
ncbi:Hypothetical protein A7982_06830 [Minicystis rosea]|nr:Hypothetical protein A7982_06830 [Minicystis rosea]